MPSSDYTASSGALKLKGAAGVTKKKKKRPKPAETIAESSSAIAKQPDGAEGETSSTSAAQNEDDEDRARDELQKYKASGTVKTEAEMRFEENRRKRMEEKLKKDGSKTHKERVEDLNRYLSKLSEHHDMHVTLFVMLLDLWLIMLQAENWTWLRQADFNYQHLYGMGYGQHTAHAKQYQLSGMLDQLVFLQEDVPSLSYALLLW
jgi:protein FAM32A